VEEGVRIDELRRDFREFKSVREKARLRRRAREKAEVINGPF